MSHHSEDRKLQIQDKKTRPTDLQSEQEDKEQVLQHINSLYRQSGGDLMFMMRVIQAREGWCFTKD